MTILVTGSTGNIGSKIVDGLSATGASTRAAVRDAAKAKFSANVEVVTADMRDVNAMRAALTGVKTLFLLNVVTPDELTQALLTLNVAKDSGVQDVVYLSVLHSDIYANVPHFAAKYATERALESLGFGATVLRPAYFMDNDLAQRESLLNDGRYLMPVGQIGLSMIHTNDIAAIAVSELLRRHGSATPLPSKILNLVGPDLLTGADLAAIWSRVLDRPIQYGGDDLDPFERGYRNFMPAWQAYDMRLMAARFHTDGMVAEPGDLDRLENMLGRKLTTYAQFASQIS